MPSKSKSQHSFFGLVLACKRGQLKNASARVKKAAASMTLQQVKDYAETKTKGLPNKVKPKSRNKKRQVLYR